MGRALQYVFVWLGILIFLVPLAEARTIRVGYVYCPGFQEGVSPEYSGYGYEYLQALSLYTGWTYEYVPVSLTEALDKLDKGELDLVGGLVRTPEREAMFTFPSVHSGISYSLLSVKSADTKYRLDDFSSFDLMRVGLLQGYGSNDSFKRICTANRCIVFFTEYPTIERLDKALQQGEVDGIITTSLFIKSEQRPIFRFSVAPFYWVTSKNAPELGRELDQALQKLRIDDRYFDKKLFDRYYPQERTSFEIFSPAEQSYLNQQGPLRVVYLENWKPLSWTAQDEHFHGIISGFLELITQKTGLQYIYIPVHSLEEGIQLLQKGQAEILATFPDDVGLASSLGLQLSQVYLSLPMAMVAQTSTGHDTEFFPRSKERSAAITHEYNSRVLALLHSHLELRLVTFPDAAQAFASVKKGQVGLALSNLYTVNYYLSMPRYAGLRFLGLLRYDSPLTMAFAPHVDKATLQAVNKVINGMAATEMNQILLASTLQEQHVSFIDFFYMYPLAVAALCILTSLLVVLLFWRNNRRIRRLLYVDSLTGLNNLAGFRLKAGKRLSTGSFQEYSLCYFDINQFKYVNATYGYTVGDKVLFFFADLLRELAGKEGIVAKISSDHFLLLWHQNDPARIRNALSLLEGRLAALPEILHINTYITVSCGIYIIKDSAPVSDLIDRANYAKTFHKNAHTNTFAFYDQSVLEQLRIEKDLENLMEQALREGQFLPYYQPKVDLNDGSRVGAEALVRWKHPVRGLLPPALFIPLFEKNGFIKKVDLAIFEAVCQQLSVRIKQKLPVLPVSCNFSRMHFRDGNFPAQINELAEHYAVPRQLLEVEITETLAVTNLDTIAALLEELKSFGFNISIDDFGTGYSSLGVLGKLNVDVLKLDKSLLDQAMENSAGVYLIESAVDMANKLHIKVLCEGVETEEQATLLRGVGCTFAQGYLYGRPMPYEEFYQGEL